MSDSRPKPPVPQWPSDPKDAVSVPSQRPRHVQISVILMYAGAFVSAASALVVIFASKAPLHKAIEESLRRRKEPVTPERVEQMANSTVTMLIIASLVAAAVWVAVAFFTSRQQNWARMVATVLGVLNIFATFVLFGTTVQQLLLLVIGIAAVAFLWTPGSRQWFGTSPRLKV
jgi:hypothetical protein